jgi:HSP20 family protein
MAVKKSEKKDPEIIPKEKEQPLTPVRRTGPSPLEEMERWFEETLQRPLFAPTLLRRFGFPGFSLPELAEVSPSVDIYEEGETVVVKAELPGLKKGDIEVNIAEDTITISGEKKSEAKVEKKDFYRVERSFGSFSRTLRLPADTQTDKAKASFKDGILEVRIPKSAAARKKVKKITVE